MALVIGNADYNIMPLKNPVNDALLMKECLEKLNFDVVLALNIDTENKLKDTIRYFQRISINSNIRLIYYAGHAFQIDGENYIIPTKEIFNDKYDYVDNTVNLSLVTSNFTENEANIVILDACRNNPFLNRISETRAAIIESELEKISYDGAIISYSTTSGETAADGIGKSNNSVFCTSLSKNILLEGESFEDILKKVRREVREVLGQKSEYIVRLEKSIYLKKKSYTDELNEIKRLVKIDSFTEARRLVKKDSFNKASKKLDIILSNDTINKFALLYKGFVETNLNDKFYDGNHLIKAADIYKNESDVFLYLSYYYHVIGNYNKAIIEINKAIILNPAESVYFEQRAAINRSLNCSTEAIADLNFILENIKNDPRIYFEIADIYIFDQKKYDLGLDKLNIAISLDSLEIRYLYERAINYIFLEQYKKAIDDCSKILEIDSNYIDSYMVFGFSFENLDEIDKAIENYSKGISLGLTFKYPIDTFYKRRADLYKKIHKNDEALQDYTKVIELNPSAENYHNRSIFFYEIKDYSSTINDITSSARIEPQNIEHYEFRAYINEVHFKEYELAVNDYQKIISIDSTYLSAYKRLAWVFHDLGKFEEAVDYCSKGIKIANNKTQADFLYIARAEFYRRKKKNKEALHDYSKAIELNPSALYYYQRSLFFFEENEFKKFIEDLNNSIKLDTNNIDYIKTRIFYYQKSKEYEKAISDYNRILKIDSTYSYAYLEMGSLYEMLGETQKAKNCYNLGIVNVKNNLVLYYQLRSKLHRITNEHDKLIDALTKLIELTDNPSKLYLERGKIYENTLEDYNNALVDYTFAIKADSQNLNCWWYRGILKSDKLNNHSSAVDDFKKILTIDSSNVNSLNWIGVFYHRLGEDSLANIYYNKTISICESKFYNDFWKKDEAAYSAGNLALLELKKMNLDNSKIYFSKSIEFDSLNSEKYVWRSWYYSHYLNDHVNALSDINKAILLKPDNLDLYLNRAEIYLKSGNYKKAREDFDNTVIKSKNNVYYLTKRGDFFSKINEFEMADNDFRKATKDDSSVTFIEHFVVENLIRQNKNVEALKILNKPNSKKENDTTSNYLLGLIYLQNKDYQKALDAFKNVVFIMKKNISYKTIEPEQVKYYLSDVYTLISQIYFEIKEHELSCNYLSLAKNQLFKETRPDKLNFQEKLNFQLNPCKN